jgi:SAM-dependent methyltransferase
MNEGFYDEQDAKRYDARFHGVPGDVELYLDLAREAHAAGQPVLELTCGTGRVAIPIARAGVRVVGLDLSPHMLAVAREKSVGLATLRLVEGDMREFELPERFGLAFIPFRSFQHMLTVRDQLSCLRCIHRHLVPGGRLAINLFNPDILRIGDWLTAKRGGVQRWAPYQDPATGRTVQPWESTDYRTGDQELESTVIDEELDEAGAVVSRVYRRLRLRYVFRYEMEHLLVRAGYEIEALYGDCSRSAFGDDSPEQIWVARRPADG